MLYRAVASGNKLLISFSMQNRQRRSVPVGDLALVWCVYLAGQGLEAFGLQLAKPYIDTVKENPNNDMKLSHVVLDSAEARDAAQAKWREYVSANPLPPLPPVREFTFLAEQPKRPAAGQWYATFSGVDCRAAVRERAVIVPVDWVESSSGYWTAKGESWPWKRPQVITEAWGWEHARPISELSFRDPVAVNGGDGYFYATGLHNYRSHARNTCILKGKDLTGATPWDATPVAGFKTVDDVPWFKDPGEPGSFLIPLCKIFPAKNTFWISLAVPGGKRTLHSESGTMNGPWKVAVEPPRPESPGASYHGSLPFEDYKGNLYGRGPVLWPMTADFSALDKNQKPPADPGYELQFANPKLAFAQTERATVFTDAQGVLRAVAGRK